MAVDEGGGADRPDLSGAEGLSIPEGLAIVVVGDVMVDHDVVGTIERVSPEAPVPVVRVATEHRSLGGAANVAHQVVTLGGVARLVGVVGDDDAASVVRELCRRQGIDDGNLVVDADRPTTTKTRVTAGRHQVVRIDRESTDPVSGAVEEQLVAAVRAAIASGERPDAVIVSDYAKGVLTTSTLRAVIEAATEHGIAVLTDPKHTDFGRYRGSTVIKANRAEVEAAVGRPLADLGDVTTEAALLAVTSGARHVIVTLGADGLVVLPEGRDPVVVPAAAQEVYDVSGAGDSVIATAALAMAAGHDVVEAARLANAVAGIVVQRRGVKVVGRAELATAVVGVTPDASKVHDRTSITELVALWRSNGQRVVFTNGCFDLFHAGHVHLLRQAALLGDQLVVAVDSDRSVRALKGPSRPIIGEAERMSIVGALHCVDAVISFDSAELAGIVAAVRPDVLVKGSDYTVAEVVGHEIVAANGGTVVLVPLLGELSTSAVVGRIRGG